MCHKCSSRSTTFQASQVTGTQIRAAIPKYLFRPQISKSLYYVARDVLLMTLFAGVVWEAETFFLSLQVFISSKLQLACVNVLCFSIWCSYWWLQGLTFTGIWLLGHDCGHKALTSYIVVDDLVGFILQTFVGTPYYSWKYTHQQHHRFNGHVEKDAHWLPKIRDSEVSHEAHRKALWDIIEDTPVFQAFSLIAQQLIGFQAYLLFNVTGKTNYPQWTSHFWRTDMMIRLYIIPWMLLNHWISMIVALSHIDNILPHYRDNAYTHTRGALVTVDREFLGWQGQFFLHNVVHFHVVHHLFPSILFYNLEEATKYAKQVLGDDYISCDTPSFRALFENYRRCKYIDPKGDIVFYKDNHGNSRFRTVAS